MSLWTFSSNFILFFRNFPSRELQDSSVRKLKINKGRNATEGIFITYCELRRSNSSAKGAVNIEEKRVSKIFQKYDPWNKWFIKNYNQKHEKL